MTPGDRERLARARFGILTATRASGVVVMLFGLWIAFGNLVQDGGAFVPGMLLFLAGMAESLFFTQWLAKRWRTPPDA